MRKINWRVAIFAVLLLSIVGTPAYVYLKAATSGGISRRGDLMEVDIYAMSNFEFDQLDGVTADVPKRTEPSHELLQPLNQCRLRAISEFSGRASEIGEGAFDIAGLCWLAVDDGFLTHHLFYFRDQMRQRHRLRSPQIINPISLTP